jgi:hypothetical protein
MTMDVPVAVTIYKSRFKHVGACSRAVLYVPGGLMWGLRASLRESGARVSPYRYQVVLVLNDQWAEGGVTLDC